MTLICEVAAQKDLGAIDVIEQVGIHAVSAVSYRGYAKMIVERVTATVDRLERDLAVWRLEYELGIAKASE